ncbi:redoxin domain-containing protein [Mucilaginibacter robiniae]|uniref:Redoxin domain-containing protein n=1 Tax=Mucilaginibacter robiniae TaxID=2728022 RepID=A0A7L5DZX9_9SPHI|nr:redoxin domain-containing protein [Mucilaginibacter robiniae]QJD96680.1 redoxin domain-containing protein [Mucilaginibacter robiniae]
MGPASESEIKAARSTLESNFNDAKAHRNYIYVMGLNNPLLIAQYRIWMKKYPQNVNFPLAIGTFYHNAEMPQAKEFLLKAAELEPQNADIWSMLANDAGRWGQDDLSTAYLRKAMLADTANATYAASYLFALKNGDPDYRQKVFDFVKRFPASEQGAQALYWLADRDTSLNDRIQDYEQLRQTYPPQKFRWSSSGMIGLADAYLQTNPEKALTLSNEMGEEKEWQIRKQLAESLIQINQLEQSQSYKEAASKADQIKLPSFNYLNDFVALKKADLLAKAGDVKAAYDSLATKYAKLPTYPLYTALTGYAQSLGKNKKQMLKDVETIRHHTAVSAYPFELDLYTSKGKLNLHDLKGKVVLLTFWFPGCSPCRAEFPHFQSVINKFKGKDVVYVGINVDPEQDPYVLPLLKNSNYSFIPLRGSSEFARKNYGVQGEPENFLIDQDGKIIFKDFRIDNSNHRTLELMISSLLQKG